MTEDELERIRERKRQELLEREGEDGDTPAPAGADASRGASAAEEPIHVGGSDHLAGIVDGHDVVLVDFYADWCGPCQMLEPVVEDLAARTPAAVAKVDVDAQQGLAREYQVRGVPTLVLFADGEVVERLTGARDRDTLEGLIRRYA